VNANEIIVHEVDRHHVSMVHGLFRKGIRKPRHTAIAHADIEILPLYMACRDITRIRAAFDTPSIAGDDIGGAFLALGSLGHGYSMAPKQT